MKKEEQVMKGFRDILNKIVLLNKPKMEKNLEGFRAGQKLFDDDPRAGRAELRFLHHGRDGFHGAFAVGADEHALAERQTIRLDDDGHIRRLQILDRRVIIVKRLIRRRRNAVLLHQVLREHLAALDDGGILSRAERGNPLLRQRIHHAEAQRVVRRDDDEIHLVLRRPADDAVHVRRLEGQAGRNLRDAAVAGRGVQRRHFRVFLDFQRDGVFASAAADDEYLHLASLTFLNAINGGTGAYA